MIRLATAWMVSGCIAVAAIGCSIPQTPEAIPADSATLNTRQWRFVLLVFDRNPDAEHLRTDIEEFRHASIIAGSAHRIVVRDSQIADGSIEFVDGDTLRTLSNSELRGCDPTTSNDLQILLDFVASRFPAAREALLLSGHGRDWAGFGLRSDTPEQTLTSTALASALTSRCAPTHEEVVVMDGSYTASCEWATGFSGLNLHLVSAAGEVPAEGLDYRRVLSSDAPRGTEEFAKDVAVAFNTDQEGGGIHLTPEDLRVLPTLVESVATAGIDRIKSSRSQQELKADLLARGVAGGVPGISWVPVENARLAVELTSSAAGSASLDRMLLYFTTTDDHGVPTGHRTDYCSNAAPSLLSPEFQSLQWAPDHQHRSGFLYHLWYRRF